MIKVQNIAKNYGELSALTDVTFNVDKGELFGFIGPDGAGKTTLFRILTTLLLPDKGSAMLADLDVVSDYRKVRNIVGYMPGQFSLYADLSVEENLDFFATVFGTTVAENYHLIKDIYEQIEPFKTRLAGRLSGGMKQKLALSCALIHEPKVLILDEPTTGVDAVSRREFWELLAGLKERGITILVSTPYMDEAGMCDRVALIQKGKLLALDKPKSIENNFKSDLYSVSGTSLHHLLLALREYENTASVFAFGQDLHLVPKSALDEHEITEYLKSAGQEEVSIRKISAGIEDVFMQLMQEENLTE